MVEFYSGKIGGDTLESRIVDLETIHLNQRFNGDEIDAARRLFARFQHNEARLSGARLLVSLGGSRFTVKQGVSDEGPVVPQYEISMQNLGENPWDHEVAWALLNVTSDGGKMAAVVMKLQGFGSEDDKIQFKEKNKKKAIIVLAKILRDSASEAGFDRLMLADIEKTDDWESEKLPEGVTNVTSVADMRAAMKNTNQLIREVFGCDRTQGNYFVKDLK